MICPSDSMWANVYTSFAAECVSYDGFPGGSDGKESACNAGDPVQSLGWEDPLEKGMATHSRILAWRIPPWVFIAKIGSALLFCISTHDSGKQISQELFGT